LRASTSTRMLYLLLLWNHISNSCLLYLLVVVVAQNNLLGQSLHPSTRTIQLHAVRSVHQVGVVDFLLVAALHVRSLESFFAISIQRQKYFNFI